MLRYLCARAWRRFAARWKSSLVVMIQLTISLIVLSSFLNISLSFQETYEDLESKLSKNTFKVVPVLNPGTYAADGSDSASLPITPLIYNKVRELAKNDVETTWYMIAPRSLHYKQDGESVYLMFVSHNYFDFFPNQQLKETINMNDPSKVYLSSWLAERLEEGAYFIENKHVESKALPFSEKALLEHSSTFDAGTETTLIEHNESLQKSVDMKNVLIIPMKYFPEFYRYEKGDLSFISMKEIENGSFKQGLQRLSLYLNEEANADYRYSIRSELDDLIHVTEMTRLTAQGFIYISLLTLLILIVGYIGMQIQYFHSRMQEFAACVICGAKVSRLSMEIVMETLFKVIPSLLVSVLCTHIIGGLIEPGVSIPYKVYWQTDMVSVAIVIGFTFLSTLPVILRLMTTNLHKRLSEV